MQLLDLLAQGVAVVVRAARQFKLLTPEENAATYTFNKHGIKHRFCAVCGIHPYAEGVDPQGNRMAAINIRCLEGIDLDSVPVQHFDGRSL